jgi:hypothetical protein
MLPSMRRFGIGPSIVAMPLVLLALTTTLRASEPAPRQGNYLNAQSILLPDRLDEPVDMKKNFQLDKGVLELRGPIDTAMRERFEAMLGPEIKTVRITSQGGQIADALRIGAIIQSRDIDVVVRDFCTGACAQYIFIAGHNRKLEDGALVGFMNTIKSSAAVLAMATDTLQVRNTLEGITGQYAYLEEELYRKRGVDASLLMDPSLAMQPRCVILKRESRAVSWNTSSNYMMWVPSRQYLKDAGVEFEGDWPKSAFWLGGVANRHLKVRAAAAVRYADDDPRRGKKDAPYSLESLRKCVLDEEPDSAAPPG